MKFKELCDLTTCPILVCKASGKGLTTVYTDKDLERFDKFKEEDDKLANSSYTTLQEEDYNKKWFSNKYDAQVKLKELQSKE